MRNRESWSDRSTRRTRWISSQEINWSSPVVAGGRVWLTAARERPGRGGGVSLRALAFDAATGRSLVDVEVVRTDDSGPLHPKNSRASPTPIVQGDRVYVHFGAEGTAALTTAGEVVWTTRLEYDSQHGNGGSPVLYNGLLIVTQTAPIHDKLEKVLNMLREADQKQPGAAVRGSR